MLVMTLVVTGGDGAVLHDGGPWQVSAPSLQSYLQVSGTWSIPDPTASVPLPRYAFAQVSGNTPPTVQAGGDLTVGEGNTVMLSGSATDTDGDPMTYIWSQTGPVTPRITFADASASSTTFTAPSVTGDTTFTFVLTAHDGTQPATDTLNVTVKETGAAFITTWAVSDSDRNITLPMMGTYSILWGDGSHSPDVNDSQFYSYDAAGTYTVTVLGEGLESIQLFGDTANARQLRSIEQWGGTKWITMDAAFDGATNMVYSATDAPNLSGVTSMGYMFNGASSFDGDLSDWNVSSVTNMVFMFNGASSFDQPLDSWNVSSVRGMYGMFYEATDFNQPLNNWNVSSVTFMNEMFNGASSFNRPLGSWNVSSVVSMSDMFAGVSHFNQNLGTWYIVPASTDFDSGASSLDVTIISAQNPYLSGQNSTYGMGSGGNSDLFEMRGSTLAFRSAPDVGSYTANVRASGSDVFENGNNWRMLEITVHDIINNPPVVQAGGDQTVGEGDTVMLSGSATDPEDNSITYTWSQTGPVAPRITFANASASSTTFTAPSVTGDTTFTFVLTAHDGTQPATDTLNVTVKETRTAFITTWTTSDSDRDITLPLEGAYSILWGDGSHSPDVSGSQSHSYNATGTYTVTVLGEGLERIRLFGDTPNARQLISIEQWGSTEWTSMDRAFYGAKNMVYHATDVPNLSGVTDMGSMFISNIAFNGDLSDWDVSSVTDMAYMFSSAVVFNGDLSDWDVSSVTDMSNMFSTAVVFNGDLSDWDVSSVTDMSNMFSTAFSFNSDLSGWDVSSVTSMSHMFSTASSFNSDLSGWDVSSVTNMYDMFSNASFFRQNLGYWYVVLNNTSIRADDTSNVVGTISAQNQALDDQNPTYGLGAGGDSDFFVITGSTLNLNPTADYSNKIWYSVSITSTGDFGTGNHRVYGITISDTDTTISDTAPTVTSIKRYDPAVENTNSQTLIYKVTFSEDVTGVTASDFVLSPSSTGRVSGTTQVTGISGSGDTYYVTVSSSTDGTYNLDLVSSDHNIVDAANNLLTNTATTSADQTYTVSTAVIDNTNPRLASIERYTPATENTDNQTLLYKATFSEDVTGVTASDFVLSPSSTGRVSGTTQVTGISGSGDTYYVTVSSSTDGTYNLDLVSSDHNIVDAANNSLTNTATTGADQTYTVSTAVIDNTNPRLASIERYTPATENTDNQTLVYKATFSEDVTGVTASDFVLSPSSTGRVSGTTQVTGISGSGDTYYVTVSSSTDGTYNLDLVSSDHNIVDAANNSLTNTATTGADQTYTVSTAVIDNTNPRLASIERYTPATENTDNQTLVYKATFSEDVTGVTVSDFTLSSDSAGGESTSTSTGQFTQTRSPNLTIPDLATVSDTITVSSSGTATSVSVEVDITHNYIGDLKIDIIAPDGTSITLHDNSGGSTVNIDQPYAPLFGSIPISGVWTLQIHDRTAPDPGVLNSWTLTINYGDTATTLSSVTDISGSGDVYYVTVSALQDGTYNLDLVSSDHNIVDAANNSLTNTATTSADQTYTVSTAVIDNTNPRLASIERSSPTSQNTDSQSLLYKATFSEDVTGVTASDFVLSPSSTGRVSGTTQVTGISGSGDTYYVTVSSSTDGTYNLDLVSSDHNIVDAANNSLTNTATTGADQTYTVSTAVIDNTNPRLASIERSSPTSQNTDSQSLLYKATFSEDVTGVTASDFVLSPSSTGRVSGTTQVTGISGSGDTYYVTVSSSTDGTYNLDLVSSDHNIVDAANNSLTNTATTGADQTYTVSTAVIDNTNPRLASIERYTPATENTDSQSLLYKATFSEDVTGVTASDFVLSPSSTGRVSGTTQVTGISGSGDTYYVTVSSSTDGTYNLDLVSSDHNIVDAANNSLTNTATTGADQTYTVSTAVIDNTNPRLASIERYTPATENTDNQTLVYKATFSEDVTGVTVSDFTLSSDSAGGESTSTSTGQFTQTRSPNLTIPNLATVSDTITVSSSGTVASVSVEVDITHNYIGDLKIDIIAPDGTSITLHDNSGGSTDNIDQPYAPLFGSIPISGVWTLQIHDRDAPDPGVLNSWTLTINYGDTATTLSSVTDISGSGDVYYVTVSALQDGTYNLDLVSSDHNIVDAANNSLTNTATTGADQTYTVSTAVIDNTNPRLASIERSSPTSQNTDSQSLLYKATFSEDVTGVTASDFVLSPSSTGRVSGTTQVTGISGSGDTYYVTVSSSTDGTYNLDLVSSDHNIVDAANNSLTNTATTGADQTYTVSTAVIDNTNPRLASIERYTPATENTDNQTLVYKATFSEDVTGVTASDFVLSPSSTGRVSGTTQVTGISGSGDTYYVTVSSSTDGTYNLDLVSSDHNIVDAANNSLTNTATTGADQTYTVSTAVIDNTNPRLASIERYTPATENTDSQSLLYKATFSEDVTGVTASDFVLSPSSTGRVSGTTQVTGISGSGDTYYVTVSSSTDGTYNLDLVSSDHNIVDAANNSLTNTATTGADQTYTVSTAVIDNTNPRLASIERYTPASQNTDSQSLLYKATFSEDVTGVTASDFVLSPSSTGRVSGTTQVTGISGSGDTYYVTVSSSTDGTYNLDLVSSDHNIVDAANNSLTNTATTGADQTYTVSTAVIDNTNPRLASIERYTPATENTDNQTLVYKATFSEDVTGVTVSDFTLSSDSAGGESTSTSTGQFTQTRSPNLTIPNLATVSDTITVSSSGTALRLS